MIAAALQVGHMLESRSTDGPTYWLVTDVRLTEAGDVMATAKEQEPRQEVAEDALTMVLISPPERELHFRVLLKASG